MKKLIAFFFFIAFGLIAQTLQTNKFMLFDNGDLATLMTWASNNGIHCTYRYVAQGKIKVIGSLDDYGWARVKNAIAMINNQLPLAYKTKDLIYLEIYISLNGNMSNVSLALEHTPLFQIYLDSYNYEGAKECISKAAMLEYITDEEANIILGIIPDQQTESLKIMLKKMKKPIYKK